VWLVTVETFRICWRAMYFCQTNSTRAVYPIHIFVYKTLTKRNEITWESSNYDKEIGTVSFVGILNFKNFCTEIH